MKKRIYFIILFLVVSVNAFAAESNKGYQIIKAQKDQNTGFVSEKALGEMVIVSPSGHKTVRTFQSSFLEEHGEDGDKALIKILTPADLKGVGLLSFQHKKKPADQWLYLPATKKSKRILGNNKSGRFIGSDFTYEDMMPRNIDDYTYQWLKTEKCDNFLCDVIEVKPRIKDTAYSKSIMWLRRQDKQTVRMDLYDKKGRLWKKALFLNHKLYSGRFWRAQKIVMKNVIKNQESDLILNDIRLGVGLTDGDFAKTVLER